MTTDTAQLDRALDERIKEWTELLAALIPDIQDDYRASEDDDTPGMLVTIGTNDEASEWAYQTGDNSYTGGAYGYQHWAIIYLYRDSVPADLAEDAASQIADLICQ